MPREVEIAVSAISDILATDGVDLLGPFPSELQGSNCCGERCKSAALHMSLPGDSGQGHGHGIIDANDPLNVRPPP
jgi:hypothetical protein